jgi:exodeoxyribonuclease VII small subunit
MLCIFDAFSLKQPGDSMPRKAEKPENSVNHWSYEETVSTIETVIGELESGHLPLAEVLSQFEQAVQALQQCETYLTEKQQQVNVLIETLGDS